MSMQARLDETLSRADEVLRERLKREIAAQQREQAEADREAADRARRNAERKRQYQVAYADAFTALGSEPPRPSDDETSLEYRCRLYDPLATTPCPRA